MYLRIQTDHNEDDTAKIINEWVTKTKSFYHKISVRHEAHPESYSDADGPCDWSLSRYSKVLQNRQIALDEARTQWADYLFVSVFYGSFNCLILTCINQTFLAFILPK